MESSAAISDRPEYAREKGLLTHAIIGKAMETHSRLGPGLREEFYLRELSACLSAVGFAHEIKPRRELVYRGFVADAFEPDLLFPDQFVCELKMLRGTFDAAHFTQILAYQKFHGLSIGLLFDFGKASLFFKRMVFTPKDAPFPHAEIPAFVTQPALARTLLRLLAEIHLAHGLGYRETTYQGLLRAALQAERIEFKGKPSSAIGQLGVAALRCLEVEGACAISITALGDGATAADRATLQTCLRWLELPWGLLVHYGRRTVDLRFVVRPVSGPTNSGKPQMDF